MGGGYIPTGIISICDGKIFQGGLTDRIKGCISAYKYALKYNLPYYISWTVPFDVRKYLEPATFDWRIDESLIIRNINISFPVLVYASVLQDRYNRFINRLPFHCFHLNKKPKQFHYYTNLNPSEKDILKLYPKLFKPTAYLKAALQEHYNVLGDKYWSFSFRFSTLLGDLQDVINKPLDPVSANELIQHNISELKLLLQDLPYGYKALIASDSSRFLTAVKDIDPRIYIVPGSIAHIDWAKQSATEQNDTWLKAFVDQHLIMGAEKIHLMMTGNMYNSSFPKFASLIGNKPFIIHKF